MGSGKLELVLHSGKGLKDVKHFGTMNPYAQVWVAGGRDARRYKTDVAKDGGPDPVWNCPIQLEVASMDNNYTVFCEISHDGTLFDRKIGEVQVSSKDLLAGGARGEKVSYPVTISSGEVKGEIILSHKFSEPSGEKKAKVPGSSRKKPQPKKKNGMAKLVVERVATKLATAVVFAGAAGVLAMADEYADADVDDEDEDYNEDENVDDDDDEDEGEGEDEDEDEDEGEDEEEDEDEYDDEDEYEYEYEDEDY